MKKSTVVAVFVFVGLLVLVLFKLDRKTERGITRVSFIDLDSSSLERIVITGENSIEMKRQDKVWRIIDGREADSHAMDSLVQAITKIESSHLVTEDPARYTEFGVDDEKGTHVTAYVGNKKVAEFVVGKSESGGANLRVGRSVYLVKGLTPYDFSKKTTNWYKLKLFDTKIDQVDRVEVSRANNIGFVLVRQGNDWRFQDPEVVPEGFRFDAAAARSLVSALVNVRASEIMLDETKEAKTGFGNQHDVLAFVDKNGQRHELHLGSGNDKQQVFAKLGGKPDLCLLNQYTVRNLKKQAVDLRDMKLIRLDVEKSVRLSISDGAKKLSLEKQGAEWKVVKTTESTPTDFQLDHQAVRHRLTALVNARGAELVAGKSKTQTGIKRSKAYIRVGLEDGSDVSIIFGSSASLNSGDGYYAFGNIDNEIYLVPKYTRDSLLGMLSSFKKQNMPGGISGIDPQALSKLPPELREKVMRQLQQKMIEAARQQSQDKP